MYIYIYIYIHTCTCTYSLAVRVESSRSCAPSLEHVEHIDVFTCTLSPPIKSLDFRGFDSSRLLILRGGNSHVRIIL